MVCYNETIMNILTTLAQSYSSSLTNAEAAGLAVFVVFFYGLMFLFAIVFYVIASLALMKIFAKAGVKPWIAWVPFYNNWKLLELGGQQGFWAVLAIVPIVSIASAIFTYIAQYHISKKLGKDGTFVLWAIFIPLVWFIWLAVDKSVWNETASTAPSLNQG